MASGGDSFGRWIVGIIVAVAAGVGIPIYLANRGDVPTAPVVTTGPNDNPGSGGGQATRPPDPDVDGGGSGGGDGGAFEPAGIFLSRLSGPTGTSINVTGEQFGANERVSIRFHTTEIGTTTASAGGTFTISVAIPEGYADFAPHDYSIVATGASSIKSARAAFKLTG